MEFSAEFAAWSPTSGYHGRPGRASPGPSALTHQEDPKNPQEDPKNPQEDPKNPLSDILWGFTVKPPPLPAFNLRANKTMPFGIREANQWLPRTLSHHQVGLGATEWLP